ncbi:hypothetical protein HAHE_33560 [Haloferula helveola]|uniref:Sulfatase N-terminal domain-containing protein n=2 Tax=Haloferula helveola TaxID=490095 RepID=A0ABN6HCC8_9BACT|nr:hypothetical protein HAHE_33560 [Haloferula helveola]
MKPLTLVMALLGTGSAFAAAPNFVFFITDDISPADLGIYGNRKVHTPNLDRIARKGLVFDNAYLTISSCSPSRCSIITGRYPHNTGAPELHLPLPSGQRTFVQELREAGYHTLLSGKNHMAKPDQLGFAMASDSGPSGSENWIRHLRERPKDQPFFFWFASHDAHHPFQQNAQAPIYDPADVPVPPMLADGPLTRRELANYYHEVSRTDTYAGRIIDELERQGILDSTYFIYCSDNGRPFPRCKTYLYDSGIRTPLLVVGPRVATGRTKSLVSSIDFSATILDLADIPIPETVQGASFRTTLSDPTYSHRDVAFAERNWHVFQLHERAVRSGKWLYIRNWWPARHNVSGESASFRFGAVRELWELAAQGELSPGQALLTVTPQPPELLFDVEADPFQMVNLAGETNHSDTLRRMRLLVEQWIEETGDSVPANPTPDRQPLHQSDQQAKIRRGDLPGADKGAERINRPGPIRTDH